MGLKNLKLKYGIDHIVQIDSRGVCIGSGYVTDLITINPITGVVTPKPMWESTLNEYPLLKAASPEEILASLNDEDVFEASIPIFTYKDDKIIELKCEKPGYPNTTHCGQLMYDNIYFTEKRVAIEAAKENAVALANLMEDSLNDHKNKLLDIYKKAVEAHMIVFSLNAQFPDC